MNALLVAEVVNVAFSALLTAQKAMLILQNPDITDAELRAFIELNIRKTEALKGN